MNARPWTQCLYFSLSGSSSITSALSLPIEKASFTIPRTFRRSPSLGKGLFVTTVISPVSSRRVKYFTTSSENVRVTLFSRFADAQTLDVSAGMNKIFSFNDASGSAYIFGLDSCLENTFMYGQIVCGTNDKSANWWRINDDPKTGFRGVVQQAKMSSRYGPMMPFTLDNRPYIFGLHEGTGDSTRIYGASMKTSITRARKN